MDARGSGSITVWGRGSGSITVWGRGSGSITVWGRGSGSITVWGRRSAFNVQKVLWTLGELGLAHEHVEAGGAAGGLDHPDFRAMNPNGRIPVLRDDAVTLWESQAIVRYLAARHDPGGLWPEEPAERALADRWMDWSQCELQPAFMELFWGFYRTPAPRRDAAAIERARERTQRLFRLLGAHLATSDFLGGSRFTMGDIPAGTALHRYFTMGVGVERPPHVMAWAARLADRPAWREHVGVPFDELFGRLAF